MTRRPVRLGFAVVLATLSLGLGACTEKPQTSGTLKADTAAFQGASDAYVAPGWKVGDAASWNQQMTTRAQAQNEYLRIGASAR
ncbi:MAG: hypothetical protein ABIN96_16555 [Rubrivivax sp.]